MEPYFVNIRTPFEVYPSEGCVRKEFDLILDFDTTNTEICANLYNHYKTINDKKIVTISSTKASSLITIPAINEKYMHRERNEFIQGDVPQFKSDLKIIYISSTPDMNKIKKWTLKDLSTSIISNHIGHTPHTVTKHNLLLNMSQILFFGILPDDDVQSLDLIKMNSYGTYFYDDIKGKNLHKTLKFVEQKFTQNEPVHIIFDLGILKQKISPLSFRNEYDIKANANKGLDIDDLFTILNCFKEFNIVGLDIVNYNLMNNDTTILNRIQSETIQTIYGILLKLSVKSVNIFCENSKFLIFKPIETIEDDIGWYILRGVSVKVRNEIINQIDSGENESSQIITVKIDDDGEEKEILVSTTTMTDQNEYSYYSSDTFLDKRLYPDEKMDAMFELVNNTGNIV